MLKYLSALSFVIFLMVSCDPDPTNQEEPEAIETLFALKLDSVRSVVTVIIDDGEALRDSRSNLLAGAYKKDENGVIRAVHLLAKATFAKDEPQEFVIDLINLEGWDSTRQNTMEIDSSFFLSNVTHLALSHITIGNVSNELLLPLQIEEDSFQTYLEGKTTLKLKNWGFDLPEPHKIHLGLSLYTLSEN